MIQIGREWEPHVAVMVCQDDDIKLGPGLVGLGMVASGVTKKGDGNQVLYSDHTRDLMHDAAPIIHDHLRRIAIELGLEYSVTSHDGCGGANAQKIEPEFLPGLTQQQVETVGSKYLGHILFSEEPVPVSNSDISASIVRPVEDHHHNATKVGWTVGFGMTEEEKQKLENMHGRMFNIQVEGFAAAVEAGDMQRTTAEKLLLLQDNVALTIAPGVRASGENRHVIFDAGRLPISETLGNAQLIQSILGFIGNDEPVKEELIVRLK